MIINSILDADLYKFTMMQAVIKLYPRAHVRYSFINRDKREFPEGFANELRKEVKSMESLFLSTDEKKFLNETCYFLEPTYIDFLSGYRYDSSEVGIIQNGSDLQISIEGPWYRTILWETTLMALISELYFKMVKTIPIDASMRKENNNKKANDFSLRNVSYADFGTRRRFSYEIHDELVRDLVTYSLHNKNFVGTSNVHLAHKHNTKAIGTMAHEWISFHAAKYGYTMANSMAMEAWVNVYRGDLGIMLPDTFTSEAFFTSFDKKHSMLFDGVRHDSGDPFEFANKTIEHYKRMNIDPLSKTIVFSDSLNVERTIEIKKYCEGKVKCSFGIGTNLTNDVGAKPLNIVIKMIAANENGRWVPTIKLSDDRGKHTGDETEIGIAKHVLNLK